MRIWWQGLSERERRLISAMLVVVVLALVWLLFWHPLNKQIASADEQIERAQVNLEWMQEAALQVRSQGGATGPTASRQGKSLLALAEETARRSGLGEAFRRGEPAGDGQVRIWFQGADFDQLIRWLESMQSSFGVEVEDASIDRAGIAGLVDARISLTDP